MKFIAAKLVAAIHDLLIAEQGRANGARDAGLLESALDHPANIAAYEKDGVTDIARLAAACAHGIVKNHPFRDGNKRTAAEPPRFA